MEEINKLKSLTITDNTKDKPDFISINKYSIAINSLQNKLINATSLDEILLISDKIIQLEKEIIIEKTSSCKEIEKEKKEIENKIDKIKRDLRKEEDYLKQVDNKLNLKVNSHKKLLENKITFLQSEYNSHLTTPNRSINTTPNRSLNATPKLTNKNITNNSTEFLNKSKKNKLHIEDISHNSDEEDFMD